MANDSKNDKWSKATARARGEKVEEETSLASSGAPSSLAEIGESEVLGMIGMANAAEIQAKIAAGEIEAAPRILTIKEGMQFTGRLYAIGSTQLPDMQDTKVMREVKTYQIELWHPTTGATGPRVSIVGSSQLDRDLPPRLGKDVIIAVGGETKTKGNRRVREYFVGEIKRPGANEGAGA